MIERLTTRLQLIVRLRYWDGASPVEVARRLGVSQMQVSRLEHQALRKLRALLRESLHGEGRRSIPL